MGLLGKLAGGGMFGLAGLAASSSKKKPTGHETRQVNGGPRITPRKPTGHESPQVNGGPGDNLPNEKDGRLINPGDDEFNAAFRSKVDKIKRERKPVF